MYMYIYIYIYIHIYIGSEINKNDIFYFSTICLKREVIFDINTLKDRCGVAKHFLTKYADVGKLENIEVHLIEQVEEGNYDVEVKLWYREKY